MRSYIPGAIIKTSVLLMGIGFLTACPFEFGDPPQVPGSCSEASDCPRNHICSDLSESCVLVTPIPKNQRLVGPFRCVIGDFRFGGSALIASWEPFTFETDDGVESFPGASVGLDSYCIVGRSDEDYFFINATSGRSFDPDFNMVVFWRLILRLRTAQIAEGNVSVVPGESYLYLCPGFPSEAAWQSQSNESCFPIWAIGAGTVNFDLGGVETLSELAGSLDLELYR